MDELTIIIIMMMMMIMIIIITTLIYITPFKGQEKDRKPCTGV